MRRTALARALMFCVGLVTALATPGLALTHGVAHHERSEDIHDAPARDAETGAAPFVGHQQEHPHASVADGVTSRSSLSAPTLASTTTTALAAPAESTAECTRPVRTQLEPSKAEPPPNPPRAPPARR